MPHKIPTNQHKLQFIVDEKKSEITGACIDDVEFSLQDIFNHPHIHALYHIFEKKLKEGR